MLSKNPFLYITALFFMIIFLYSCKDDESFGNCPNCPVIESLSTTEAFVGDTLTVIGRNFDGFDSSNSENKVTIANTPAIYIDHTPTQVRVEITQMTNTGILKICATNKNPNQSNILCSEENPTLTINEKVLSAQFEIGEISNNGYAPATVQFINTSVCATTFEWNFGDPTSSSQNSSQEENPIHVFQNPGVYNVTLMVTNESTLDQKSISLNITVDNVITFEKTFGGSGYDSGHSIIERSNGGFAIVGETRSYGNGDSDVFLILTDENGNELPNSGKTFGGSFGESGFSIIERSDGGFAIIGYTGSFGNGGTDFYLILTDENGNELPNSGKTFGGPSADEGHSIIEMSNGGFAIAGATVSYGNGLWDFYLILTDENGNELSNSGKTFGGPNFDFGYSLIETASNGFAIVGNTDLSGNFVFDAHLILTDESGNELPSSGKTFGGSSIEEAFSIIKRSTGGFAIVGYTSSFGNGSNDFYLILTDENGNELPNSGKTFGGSSADNALSIVERRNGGFAIAGSTYSFGNGSNDFYLILTDEDGNELPNSGKTFGTSDGEYGRSLIETSDGGFAIIGTTNFIGIGDSDIYFVKTDSEGNIN